MGLDQVLAGAEQQLQHGVATGRRERAIQRAVEPLAAGDALGIVDGQRQVLARDVQPATVGGAAPGHARTGMALQHAVLMLQRPLDLDARGRFLVRRRHVGAAEVGDDCDACSLSKERRRIELEGIAGFRRVPDRLPMGADGPDAGRWQGGFGQQVLKTAAEEVGLDSVVTSDHFLPWRHEGGHAPFAIAWMTAVGERTGSIVLGTSVLTPTFRYNPAVLAQVPPHMQRHDAYSMFVLGFQNPIVSAAYIIANVLLGRHLAHGAASMFATLGLAKGKRRVTADRIGLAIGMLVMLGNVAFPIAVLAGVIRL